MLIDFAARRTGNSTLRFDFVAGCTILLEYLLILLPGVREIENYNSILLAGVRFLLEY